MANITLKNVNKIYKGGVHAVKDFSMDIQGIQNAEAFCISYL